MAVRVRPIFAAAVAWLTLAAFGCSQLFQQSANEREPADRLLPAIRTLPTVVELQIQLVERPADDPILNFDLWQEVDQVGAVGVAARDALRANGLRVGHTGANPPRSLQALLALPTDAERENWQQQPTGRSVVVPPGVPTEVATSPTYETCAIRVANGKHVKTGNYKTAKCVLRIKAQRLQDGWARLEFVPEIHNGERGLRYTAIAGAAGGWQHRTAQDIEPLYPLRFEVTLNVGEIVVVGADSENPAAVGRHFFLAGEADADHQRLLVVRLADMGRGESVYGDALRGD